MEASWNRKLCSALVILGPMTNARNWASSDIRALLFNRLISWWIRKALCATMLSCFDLDPLAGPENVVVRTSGAVGTALSPLLPRAFSIYWAGLWCLWHARWTTWNNLLFTQITALLTAKLGLLGDNPLTRLGTLWVVHRTIGILALL